MPKISTETSTQKPIESEEGTIHSNQILKIQRLISLQLQILWNKENQLGVPQLDNHFTCIASKLPILNMEKLNLLELNAQLTFSDLYSPEFHFQAQLNTHLFPCHAVMTLVLLLQSPLC